MKNKDLATTIVGGVIAAATAAEPVINGMTSDFGTPDIIKLVIAVGMAVFGWLTNKPTVG